MKGGNRGSRTRDECCCVGITGVEGCGGRRRTCEGVSGGGGGGGGGGGIGISVCVKSGIELSHW